MEARLQDQGAAQRNELRQYGLLMGTVIGLVFGVAIPLWRSHGLAMAPLAASAVFFALAVFRPQSLRLVHVAWMRFGHVMGSINGYIILTVVYILVIVPMSLVMRLMRKDPLSLKLDPTLSTYKCPCTPAGRAPAAGMESPF